MFQFSRFQLSGKTGTIAAIALALSLTAAACGSDDAPSTSNSTSSSMSAPSTSAANPAASTTSQAMTSADSAAPTMTSGAMQPASLVGPGCADYAKANPDGAGSVAGMAADPLATAASNNPLLTTLVAAVSGKVNPKVDLVTTLNSADFTVFAPVDTAFAKIDANTMKTLGTDADLLTKILTYHVIAGQIAPDAIVGTHTTVEGQDLTVEGTGDNLTINGESMVICGGVTTKNATVYLIDTVLMPPAN